VSSNVGKEYKEHRGGAHNSTMNSTGSIAQRDGSFVLSDNTKEPSLCAICAWVSWSLCYALSARENSCTKKQAEN